MITEIGESIEVDAVFNNGRVRPVGFAWNGRVYRVKKIHGRYHDLVGRCKRFHFAIGVGGGDVFELMFSTEDMSWELIRIHSEG